MTLYRDEEAVHLAERAAVAILEDLKVDGQWVPGHWEVLMKEMGKIAEHFHLGDAKALYLYARIGAVAQQCLSETRRLPQHPQRLREFVDLVGQHVGTGGARFIENRRRLYFGGQIVPEDAEDIFYNMTYLLELVRKAFDTFPDR